MRLVVVSHKVLRRAADGSFATDGGFPMQVAAISGLFSATTLCAPVSAEPTRPGDISLVDEVRVAPLAVPIGDGLVRKLLLPVWLVRSLPILVAAIWRADAVHTPIPGDVGTVGILLAEIFKKRLFVRHCGNWLLPRTRAERWWRGYMERFAGGRRVMLATGGRDEPPSSNPAVQWIFSTSLTNDERRRIGRLRSLPVERAPRLAIAGRLVDAKGIGTAIEAIALLSEAAPDLSLLVIGDGPDRGRFEDLAERVGIADRIVFTGQVTHDEILGMLHSVDLFVFPTASSEGFPKAVGEALAAGIPVVATPVSVLPTLLGTGAGVVIPERTPRAVADGIAEVLDDASRYSAMSRAALSASRGFTLERWQNQIRTALEDAWGPLGSTPAQLELPGALR